MLASSAGSTITGHALVVHRLDDHGFVVNSVRLEGSILTAGRLYAQWKRPHDMDSLALLLLLKPAPGVAMCPACHALLLLVQLQSP